MLKINLFSSFLCCTFMSVSADQMIGPGKWKMLKIDKKEGLSDNYEFNIEQRKYNRTHDMFQGSMTFHEELNNDCGAKIDVCKHVDGGCKQYLVVSDDSFGSLLGKYAADNFKEILRLAGSSITEIPVPAGIYKFKEYLWNWDSMPEEGPYGRYSAHCCVMKGTAEQGCLGVEVLFEKNDEDDEDE